MKKIMLAVAFLGSMAYVSAITAIVVYVATDPASRVSQTQNAILAEYLKGYCRRVRLSDREMIFNMGSLAAISRITIKAGLGDLALAEYAKCKISGKI